MPGSIPGSPTIFLIIKGLVAVFIWCATSVSHAMRLPAYLARSRHGVFYLRWPIPPRLHPARRRTHLRLSLRTRCPTTAQHLSRALVLAGQTQLARATASVMRYGEIREHVAAHFRDMLLQFQDGIDAAGPPDAARLDALAAAEGLAADDPAVCAAAMHSESAPGLLVAFCDRRGIRLDDLTEQHRDWLLDALRAGHAAFASAAQDSAGALGRFDFRAQPVAPAASAAPPSAAAPASVPAAASYTEVTQQYLNELQRTRAVRAKTADGKREALALLGEITGNKAPAELTKADVRAVKDTLRRATGIAGGSGQGNGEVFAELPRLPPAEVHYVSVRQDTPGNTWATCYPVLITRRQ